MDQEAWVLAITSGGKVTCWNGEQSLVLRECPLCGSSVTRLHMTEPKHNWVPRPTFLEEVAPRDFGLEAQVNMASRSELQVRVGC